VEMCIQEKRFRVDLAALLEPGPLVGALRLFDLDLDVMEVRRVFGKALTTRTRTAGSDAQTKPQASSSSVQIVTRT